MQIKSGSFFRNLKTFDSLKNPAFRSYYSGLLCNMVSMNIQIVARSLLIYRLTGSAAILGLLALSHALPMVCLSLFGGVIADRLPKKQVLVVDHGCLSVIAFAVALSTSTGIPAISSCCSMMVTKRESARPRSSNILECTPPTKVRLWPIRLK